MLIIFVRLELIWKYCISVDDRCDLKSLTRMEEAERDDVLRVVVREAGGFEGQWRERGGGGEGRSMMLGGRGSW